VAVFLLGSQGQAALSPRCRAGCVTESDTLTASGRASTSATACAAAVSEVFASKSSPGDRVTLPPCAGPASSLPNRTMACAGTSRVAFSVISCEIGADRGGAAVVPE
jgi:hypothetical protein